MNDIDFYLYIERLQVQGSNAISSPLTYGFPAITAILGAVHALQRKMPFEASLQFEGALVASHDCRVKRYRPHSYSDYTFNLTRNPIKKNGKTAAIVEEGKLDMTISLVIPIRCDDFNDLDWLSDNKEAFLQWAYQTLLTQRLAGGSVFGITAAELMAAESLDQLKYRLAPAFILMDARQELIEITEDLQNHSPESTTLDALLDVAVLHHIPELEQSHTAATDPHKKTPDKAPRSRWKTTSVKQGRGWLVPMPVGYQAISPLFDPGVMEHSRTPQYPSQYVETVYSLGKWVFPYSLNTLEQAFWHMNTYENGLYLTEQTQNQE